MSCCQAARRFLSGAKYGADIRKNMFASVMSSGGMALFHGTGECMTKEPTPLAPFTLVGIGRSPIRKHHHVGAERFTRAVIYSNQNPPHHEEQRLHPQDYSPISCCRVAPMFLQERHEM